MPRDRFVVDPQGAALAGERFEGAGPTAVLLHAGVADRRSWNSTIEALDGTLTAIAYDRRGFGETPAGEGSWSNVDDLLAVLDHLGEQEPVWLVGNSAGGGIALEAALCEPLRVAGLVLIAPAVSGAPSVALDPASAALRDALEPAYARGGLDEVNRLELRLWLDGPGQPEGRVSGEVRRLAEEMNRIALQNEGSEAAPAEPVWNRLCEIDHPVLVLCGELDLPHIRSRSEYLGTSLRHGRYESLGAVAHLPQMERPREVARRLTEAIV